MHNITGARATLRAIVRHDAKDTLAGARALHTIRQVHPLDRTVTIAREEGLMWGRTRINTLIKAFQAAPADVTAEDFRDVYVKAVTDANRDAGKAKREAKPAPADTPDAPTVTAEDVPQGNAPTVTDAIRALWMLTERFGEDALFVAALADVLDFVTPDTLTAVAA